ncbi:MAG: radical SAM protein [Chloroflexota bacterium]
MDAISRLRLLSAQMSLEPAEEASAGQKPVCFTPKQADEVFIHPAQMPNGRQIKLLKTLLSSACERDCFYCPFRAGRDMRRATFKPDEFAALFMNLHRVGAVEGLFVSSGLAGGGVRTQDKLLDTVDILRHRLGFGGYVHLKLMPGAEKDQVLRAMQLADRVSVNLEAPNTERLSRLAPHKQFFEELLQPLKWVDEIRRTMPPPVQPWRIGLDTGSGSRYGERTSPTRPSDYATTQPSNYPGRWPSTTTQFVAGGADESDLELLTTTDWLQRNLHLKRAYFSAFSPIPDTPLENKAPTDPLREHRLYQASFLLRDYGFDLEELPFSTGGNLPLPTDPKQAWAESHLSQTPLELNTADRSQLLRVPGIGPKGAEKIVRARRERRLRDLSMLKKLGIDAGRAAPFVLLDGQRMAAQMRLF